MNVQLKELIDCMQKGWNQLPRNPTDQSSFCGTYEHPTSACPLAHAILGKTGHVSFYEKASELFPILTKQKVKFPDDGFTLNLTTAVINLADCYKWTTPQVIGWLKSHLKD